MHFKLNIFCQHSAAGFKHGQFQLEHGLAGRQGGAFAKAKKNCVLLLRECGKLFLFFFKAPPHGLHRVHLFLQHCAAVRVAAADGALVMLNLVANAAKTFHFFVEIPAVALRHLLLVLKKLCTATHIFAV